MKKFFKLHGGTVIAFVVLLGYGIYLLCNNEPIGGIGFITAGATAIFLLKEEIGRELAEAMLGFYHHEIEQLVDDYNKVVKDYNDLVDQIKQLEQKYPDDIKVRVIDDQSS